MPRARAARRPHTTSRAEKTLRLSDGDWGLGRRHTGYEIHHGRITGGAGEEFLGGVRTGNVFGTMWHGSLEDDAFRTAFLGLVTDREPSGVSFPAARQRRLDLLADLVERHLDVDALHALVEAGAPAGMPVLPPAGTPG